MRTLVAVLTVVERGAEPSADGEELLSSQQRADAELAPVIEYLETGVLPKDEKSARTIYRPGD